MSTAPNQGTRVAIWGAAAVETAGSNPSHRPSESTNVTVVTASAPQRIAFTDGSASSSERAERREEDDEREEHSGSECVGLAAQSSVVRSRSSAGDANPGPDL